MLKIINRRKTSYLQNKPQYFELASWYPPKNTYLSLNNTRMDCQQHKCNTRSQHGTLWPRLNIRLNGLLQPILNVILIMLTAQTTKPESLFRPRVGQNRGERKRGKLVYTEQVHYLVSRVLCQGFETKHGTVCYCIVLYLL